MLFAIVNHALQKSYVDHIHIHPFFIPPFGRFKQEGMPGKIRIVQEKRERP